MSAKEDIFEYPKWMECQWRRERCNKIECPLCYRLLKQEQKHRLRGEDPNDIKVALEDVKESFDETFALIQEGAEELGIDLNNIPEDPKLEERDQMEHPFYKKIHAWIMKIHGFMRNIYESESPWINTEEWKDLSWYHTMLGAKVYRQLCNKWDMENVDRDPSDYIYTKGVIEEIIKILKKSFQSVLSYNLTYSEKSALQDLFDEFLNFETDLLSI
jgi:hypothetical protein